MSTPNLPRVESGMSTDQLANLVAILIKELTWLLTGHLDVKNIRAEGIETKNLKAGSVIAEKISVEELSAISADLGTITAGTVIGALIKTAVDGQRVELSSVENLLRAINAAGGEVRLIPDVFGSPGLVFEDGSGSATYAYMSSSGFNAVSTRDITLSPGIGYKVIFRNWNDLLNNDTGRTLQQELSLINARLAALGG